MYIYIYIALNNTFITGGHFSLYGTIYPRPRCPGDIWAVGPDVPRTIWPGGHYNLLHRSTLSQYETSLQSC